jgi:hypothetical protein
MTRVERAPKLFLLQAGRMSTIQLQPMMSITFPVSGSRPTRGRRAGSCSVREGFAARPICRSLLVALRAERPAGHLTAETSAIKIEMMAILPEVDQREPASRSRTNHTPPPSILTMKTHALRPRGFAIARSWWFALPPRSAWDDHWHPFPAQQNSSSARPHRRPPHRLILASRKSPVKLFPPCSRRSARCKAGEGVHTEIG